MRVAQHMRADEGPTAMFGLVLDEAREGYARVSTTITQEMLVGPARPSRRPLLRGRCGVHMPASAGTTRASPSRLGDLVAEAVELGVEGRSGSYSVSICLADGRLAATFTGLSRTLGASILPAKEAD